MSTEERLEDVAVHEAGHAACALLLGKKWGCAVFGEGGEGGGLAGEGKLGTPPDGTGTTAEEVRNTFIGCDDFREILNDSTITAAGYVAADMNRGTRRELMATEGPDRAKIDEAARKLLGDGCSMFEVQGWHAMVKARAMALLSPQWHRVLAVAERLKEKRALSSEEVAEAMFSKPEG